MIANIQRKYPNKCKGLMIFKNLTSWTNYSIDLSTHKVIVNWSSSQTITIVFDIAITKMNSPTWLVVVMCVELWVHLLCLLQMYIHPLMFGKDEMQIVLVSK
jgi:hypothetical protein